MDTENTGLNYDEDEAVKYIQKHLPTAHQGKFSDDEINYILDVVYDFYENKGYFSEEVEEDTMVEINEDELIEYVMKSVKKDKIKPFTEEEVTLIIEGELNYCESLNIFE